MNTRSKYLVGLILIRTRYLSLCMIFGAYRNEAMPAQANAIDKGWI